MSVEAAAGVPYSRHVGDDRLDEIERELNEAEATLDELDDADVPIEPDDLHDRDDPGRDS